jgi:hypothetical protein
LGLTETFVRETQREVGKARAAESREPTALEKEGSRQRDRTAGAEARRATKGFATDILEASLKAVGGREARQPPRAGAGGDAAASNEQTSPVSPKPPPSPVKGERSRLAQRHQEWLEAALRRRNMETYGVEDPMKTISADLSGLTGAERMSKAAEALQRLKNEHEAEKRARGYTPSNEHASTRDDRGSDDRGLG